MQGLTPRCAELLGFLERHSRTPGSMYVMPSYDEMVTALGLHSKSGVSRILGELEERGYLRRPRSRSRAIELIPQLTHCPHCGNYLGAPRQQNSNYSESANAP